MKIFHIDDSSTALKMLGNTFRNTAPEAKLTQFNSGSVLIEALRQLKAEDLPTVIFSDVTMPDMNGFEVLSYLKRHSRYHSIPVVMVTAEIAESQKNDAKLFGAFGYIEKPLIPEKLHQIFKKLQENSLQPSELAEIDQSFADETLEHADEMVRATKNLNSESAKEVYRNLHTIKGGANSLQFLHLGKFVHTSENFLNAVVQGGLFSLPQVTSLFQSIIGYLETQAEQIKAGELLDLPPQDLLDGLQFVKANVDLGWQIAPPTPKTSHPSATEPEPAESAVISKSKTSVRIANEKLNELQTSFRKVLQLRTQLNRFAMQLKQEFSDEGFPNDLLKLVDELGFVSADLMEFFISLRVIPVTRLRNFATRVVDQTKEQLGKSVQIEFESEPFLEIDQNIIETLENALTHILRNSIDHGIEKSEDRVKAGKEPSGIIKLNVKRESKDIIACMIKDDGAGINREKLKKAMIEKKIISADRVSALSPENIDELIFVDGLSTKTEVSEISGRGVGLSAVHEQIKSLGGTIKVTSSPGVGTQFFITLPRIFQL